MNKQQTIEHLKQTNPFDTTALLETKAEAVGYEKPKPAPKKKQTKEEE